MGSLQFGVGSLNACPDPVSVLPFGLLLDCVHMIPEAKPGSDLQTEVPNRITGVTTFIPMVGSAHRAPIKQGTRSTECSVKDRKERAIRCFLGAQHAVVDGVVPHGTRGNKAFGVECKKVPAHDVVTGACAGRRAR